MQKTKNLELNKPDYEDLADIAPINDNMEILDNEVHKNTTAISNLNINKADKTHNHNNGADLTNVNANTVDGKHASDLANYKIFDTFDDLLESTYEGLFYIDDNNITGISLKSGDASDVRLDGTAHFCNYVRLYYKDDKLYAKLDTYAEMVYLPGFSGKSNWWTHSEKEVNIDHNHYTYDINQTNISVSGNNHSISKSQNTLDSFINDIYTRLLKLESISINSEGKSTSDYSGYAWDSNKLNGKSYGNYVTNRVYHQALDLNNPSFDKAYITVTTDTSIIPNTTEGSSGYWHIMHFPFSNGCGTQLAMPFGTSKLYTRSSKNNIWSEWSDFTVSRYINSSVDWDTLTQTGIYHIKTTAGSNRPDTNHNGTLYVDNNVGTPYQIFIPDGETRAIYKRSIGSSNWIDMTTVFDYVIEIKNNSPQSTHYMRIANWRYTGYNRFIWQVLNNSDDSEYKKLIDYCTYQDFLTIGLPLSVDGDITANEGKFIGDGSGITNINYDNIVNKPEISANGGNADTVDGKHAIDLQNYNNLTNKPDSLKNPYSLTIQGNGTTLTNGTYDGSSYKTVNITPLVIGALPYTVVNNGDFNEMKTPGIYTMRSVSSNKPLDSGGYYGLIVLKSDNGDYIEQIAFKESGYQIYIRYYNSSGWSEWKQLNDYNNLINKPTSLKNPNSLNIQFNGATNISYDGSTAKTINITPSAIGATVKGELGLSAATFKGTSLDVDKTYKIAEYNYTHGYEYNGHTVDVTIYIIAKDDANVYTQCIKASCTFFNGRYGGNSQGSAKLVENVAYEIPNVSKDSCYPIKEVHFTSFNTGFIGFTPRCNYNDYSISVSINSSLLPNNNPAVEVYKSKNPNYPEAYELGSTQNYWTSLVIPTSVI